VQKDDMYDNSKGSDMYDMRIIQGVFIRSLRPGLPLS